MDEYLGGILLKVAGYRLQVTSYKKLSKIDILQEMALNCL